MVHIIFCKQRTQHSILYQHLFPGDY
uniref:Uncharacterized protein n=1 Tax=Anguilla anguilla TaxID=7936 RepID=A0A0E9TH41_ANGAN